MPPETGACRSRLQQAVAAGRARAARRGSARSEPKPDEQLEAALPPEPAPAEPVRAAGASRGGRPRGRVEAVEIDGRKIFVAGAADPGRRVRGYANAILLGDALASPDGRFLIEAERDLPVGDYIIRIDALDADGATVVARAAVPFEREPGETIAAVAPPVKPRLLPKPLRRPSLKPRRLQEAPPATAEAPAEPAAPPAVAEAPRPRRRRRLPKRRRRRPQLPPSLRHRQTPASRRHRPRPRRRAETPPAVAEAPAERRQRPPAVAEAPAERPPAPPKRRRLLPKLRPPEAPPAAAETPPAVAEAPPGSPAGSRGTPPAVAEAPAAAKLASRCAKRRRPSPRHRLAA